VTRLTSSQKAAVLLLTVTAVLEELSGILDGVENKEFANGNEIGEHLLFLISTADRSVSAQGDTLQALLALLGESSTSIEVKAAVMRILGQDGSVSTGTANIQQAGQLSTVESPSGATTAAQGSELIDALKSVSTDEALSKEADGASLRGSVGQVKAETGERANLASISDGTAASGDEVSLNKKPVPSALEFQLKASAEQQVISISPDDYLEKAALVMRDHQIGGIPVVEDNKLVGIITESDIFDAFIELMGLRDAGTRLELILDDKPGMLVRVAEIVWKNGGDISHLAVFRDRPEKANLVLQLRTKDIDTIVETLKEQGIVVRLAKWKGHA
jgi:acetoin utilization protein AcuB